ncbi:hypothetical protein MKW98_006459, partial [Papaver atlanticum]
MSNQFVIVDTNTWNSTHVGTALVAAAHLSMVLEAASSVMCASDVPVETLMHFIAKVPRQFTDYGGSLREKVKE